MTHRPTAGVPVERPRTLDDDRPTRDTASDAGDGLPATDPEAVGPEAVGPEAVGSEAVGPEAVGPEAVGPEAVGPEAAGPEAAGPEAVGPEAVGPEAVGPEAVGPEAVGSDVDADAYDPDSLDGVETGMSRLLRRTRGWLAAVVALAMLLPLGGWAINEYAFGAAGDAVEEGLGDDAGLADALLLVRSVDCDGRASSGSAFALDLDGDTVIVTNRHVVENSRSIGVRRLAGGPALAVASARLAETADVAVLELADRGELPPRLRPGHTASVGDQIRIVGFPGAQPAFSQGEVALAEPGRMLLDLAVAPGSSGSPVLAEDGRVVGQVHALTADGRGVATPLAALRAAVLAATPAPSC